MKSPLSILMVEDSPRDAELIEHALHTADIACQTTRVDTAAEFTAALQYGGIDLILSDCQLPLFDGDSALKLAKAHSPEIPFIFVSGTLGEELAIETLRSGATDYVLKHRLSRLAPVVRRAMAEYEGRIQRKELEKAFMQAQKLEVVGRLTAGITHDFNNLLTIINGYADLLLSGSLNADQIQKSIQQISLAGQRSTVLTARLLGFVSHRAQNTKVVELNAVVSNAEDLLRRLAGDNNQVIVEMQRSAGCIQVDPTQVEQILLNLAANARDAMPDGGELTVTTEAVCLDDAEAAAVGLTPGNYAVMVVADTGFGMDEATKARIFEAFFTTKEVGRGTGLGLWSAREIIQRAKGTITVDSEPGRGTTFRVYFAQTDETPEPVLPELGIPKNLRGTATVLVVDDEAAIRELLYQFLHSAGYEVLLARDAAEALEVVKREKQIKLLLTNITLPNLDGVELASQSRAINAAIKVIYSSGHAGREVPAGAVILSKPFPRGVVLRTVRDVLTPRLPSVLVVDDDPLIRTLLSDILTPAGYSVLLAANGAQALRQMRSSNVDLLITDLVMPEQEGLETIKKVAQDFPRVPMIAMSGGMGEPLLRTAKLLGAREVIQKPINAQAMLRTIAEMVGAHEAAPATPMS